MTIDVEASDDAASVRARAEGFLASEPVRHNLVQTILRDRAASGEPGRYWTATSDGHVVGVALQSPLNFFATATPMPGDVAGALVDAIVAQEVRLPGVNAEAAVAARFAGHWTERTKQAARPVAAGRIYAVERVAEHDAPGGARTTTPDDRALLVEWFDAFAAEAHAPRDVDTASVVDLRIANGGLWIWEDEGPVAFAGRSLPVGGAVRIGPVFTAPERRGHGYASALVARMSADVRAEGRACLLYTDLANPTSNAIYRAIGYAAVAETVHYEFR